MRVELSTRPEKSIGTDEQWERAEAALREALERQGREYQLNPGDGAFYGPKIDFHVTDALGRSWQCGTCQLDFQMPERFDLTYQGADNAEHRPVMIHRALLGSMERFVGILIEHYAGALPGLAGAGAGAVLPVADRHADYAAEVAAELRRDGRPGASRRPHGVGGHARSATPSWPGCPTCWWSATASRRPARSRSLPRGGRPGFLQPVGVRDEIEGRVNAAD